MVPIVERIKLRGKCVSMLVRQIKLPFSFHISNAVFHITAFQVVAKYYMLPYSRLQYKVNVT